MRMEVLSKNEFFLKRLFKRFLISSASWWLSPSEKTDEYLCYYGARKKLYL